MSSEADLTWRNILLLCGGTVGVSVAASFFVMERINTTTERRTDEMVERLQLQIDTINARLNASHRDMEINGE